jgi:hypothetical protein
MMRPCNFDITTARNSAPHEVKFLMQLTNKKWHNDEVFEAIFYRTTMSFNQF